MSRKAVRALMRFLPDVADPGVLRVGIVGFGYVGSCLGVTLARRGLTVVGVDSDESTIRDLRAGRSRVREPGLATALAQLAGSPRLTVTDDYDLVRDVDVIIITVGTPVAAHGGLVTGPLTAACQQLGGRLRRGQLVIVKSTVPPGTTRTLVAPLLEAGGLSYEVDFGLAYCPERLAEGNALAEAGALPVVVGGCGPHAGAAAARFWTRALGVIVHLVPSAETAEMVKLATNWWIDANVAIANELARYCAAVDVDVLDVLAAANTLPKGSSRINILLPGPGVGGPCLVKDPWMAWRAGRDRGVALRTIETARQVNDDMPTYTAEVISDELVKLGRDPAAATVAVLGVAFKSNTGDLRNTPVKQVIAALSAAGTRVRLHDPLADVEALRAEFGQAAVPNLAEAVAGADCVAILAGHDEFRRIDYAGLRRLVAMPCLIFDGRMYYPSHIVARLRELGYTYRGVGR